MTSDETFGEGLRRWRLSRGLSLRKLQMLSAYDYTYLSQVERGQKPGSAELAQVCDQALGAVGELLAIYRGGTAHPGVEYQQPATTSPTLSMAGLTPLLVESVDDDYLSTVRSHISQIVDLDNRFGGAELARLTVRLFHSVHHQLGAGRYPKRLEYDLQAVAGELAEVAGWLAYDANLQDLVRRMNQEALYFSRLAGDRAIELLTIQNASMHAGFLGRPREALLLANSVLEGSSELSPRVRALFLARQARARAQFGDESAMQLFGIVRSLHQEGVQAADPAWAWWVDEREIAWHEAMANADLGRANTALELFEQSVVATEDDQVRSRYLHRGYLLSAQVNAGTWSAAEQTMHELGALVPEVASTRTVVLVRGVLATIGAADAPSSSQDHAHHLQHLLSEVAA